MPRRLYPYQRRASPPEPGRITYVIPLEADMRPAWIVTPEEIEAAGCWERTQRAVARTALALRRSQTALEESSRVLYPAPTGGARKDKRCA